MGSMWRTFTTSQSLSPAPSIHIQRNRRRFLTIPSPNVPRGRYWRSTPSPSSVEGLEAASLSCKLSLYQTVCFKHVLQHSVSLFLPEIDGYNPSHSALNRERKTGEEASTALSFLLGVASQLWSDLPMHDEEEEHGDRLAADLLSKPRSWEK